MCRAIREKLRAACSSVDKSPEAFSFTKCRNKVSYVKKIDTNLTIVSSVDCNSVYCKTLKFRVILFS